MIHAWLPAVLVAVLFGLGLYGVLARRNAVLVLIGVELMIAAAGLLLVTSGAVHPDPRRAGLTLTLFLITIAAAEIAVALGVVIAVFRARGDVDMSLATGETRVVDATDPNIPVMSQRDGA
ncbi:NADH-quinone oxidoreductase subunit NuoK [Calidifontibacter sp. DB0510]|uniref:NADH-quinone oxidoreductase subunit K n=1 Tax=Metallococcus carri TaxID=1656884 RepID=A0A967AZF3_9MICO|nr:NADH-quinone oxidoreductase subunit NuoK [Metallococcus carri]NHN55237.1 NADH-quinone oxidoreductase subunit NuoK [Metallococcus carri]NOP36314.1 NADH-quinone oxidoreductase subunit NuoK [Calidifontibacter sp. DB2511S]